MDRILQMAFAAGSILAVIAAIVLGTCAFCGAEIHGPDLTWPWIPLLAAAVILVPATLTLGVSILIGLVLELWRGSAG